VSIRDAAGLADAQVAAVRDDPRLQDLYEWSAQELEEPRLAELIANGKPRYAWSATESHVWEETPTMPAASTLLAAATGLRRRRPSYRWVTVSQRRGRTGSSSMPRRLRATARSRSKSAIADRSPVGTFASS
jgi:hypothetical protein